MQLNLFSISGLFLAIICFILVFIILKYGKTRLHRVWVLFNIAVGIWGIGAFFIGWATTEKVALFWLRIAHIGVILIPVFFLHVIFLLCGISRKKMLVATYFQGTIFLLLSMSNLFLSRMQFVFDSFYFSRSEGLLYPFFFIIWMSIISYSLFELVKTYWQSHGLKRNRIRFFLLGTTVGFSGGIMNFFPHFGILIYPFGNFTISLYCIIVTYAILRHHLMDISFVFKRTAAYSLSAGLLTALFVVLVMTATNLLSTFMHVDSFKISIIAAIIIAILFNPLRNKIQKLIDKLFYKKSYDYYATIQHVSSTLASMFNSENIFKFISDTIYGVMGLKSVHLLTAASGGAYEVAYQRSLLQDNAAETKEDRAEGKVNINRSSGIVKFFNKSNEVLIKDEMARLEEIIGMEGIKKIEKELETFNGEAVVPVFIDRKLTVLQILGSKLSGDMFSSEDISLLKTISDQAAIALKNAELYKDKLHTERLASIGMMSATFAHEIRNPLTSLKTFAQLMPEKYNDEEFRDTFSRIVVGDIKKIDDLIRDLLDFSVRKKATRMNNFNLTELVDEVVDYVKEKLEFEKSKIVVEKKYNGKAINMSGDTVKLKRALDNIMINGCQAMQGEGTLKIGIKENVKNVDVEITDTGEGIHPEDLSKIFDPFVTKKEMGVGLGLAISKRIIEDHNGKIHVRSKLTKGTTFTISLPIQKG